MKGYDRLSLWGRTCKAQLIILGKSLQDVSNETGYSITYISMIINERIRVPDETRDKISKCLQVDVPYTPAV